MKIILAGIIILIALVATLHVIPAYAPCIEGPGINCNGYPPQTLTKIKSDILNYAITDKPIITINGTPHIAVHLEVDDSASNIMLEHDLDLSLYGNASYALDISSYKPGVYSVTATSLMSKMTTNFAVGLLPIGGPRIDLLLPKPIYAPGEIIQVTGFYRPSTIIHVDLVDPNGVIKNSTLLQSDYLGNFQKKFVTPNNAINGTWTINATSGPIHNTMYITVLSTNYNTNQTNPNHSNPTNILLHFMTPLQQFKSGIKADDVKCNADFLLAIKLDYSPACVKESSATKLFLRGWALGFTNYQPAYFVKPNSAAKIFVKYYPQNYAEGTLPDMSIQLYSRIYDLKSDSGLATTEISATAKPDFIHTNSSIIVSYAIATGNTKGVYWLSLLDPCVVIPIAVNLDGSELATSDLQNPASAKSCPAPMIQFHVVDLSNVTLKLVHD